MLKILHKHHTAFADDYILPLNLNISKAQEIFLNNYSEKKNVFLNSFPMIDDALNIIPDELHNYLVTDKIWIGYFHNQRRSKSYIPIHIDNHANNIKYPCSINIPLIGCVSEITTSFWEPVGEVKGLEKPKSEWYDFGELNHAFEFALTDTPVLYNNQKWHSVFNPMPQSHERAIMIFKFNNFSTDWNFFKELTANYHIV